MYTTNPVSKIEKILKFCREPKNLQSFTAQQFADLIADKYNVGVEIMIGRLNKHLHTFEIWQKNRNQYMRVICYIDIEVGAFKQDIDFVYDKETSRLVNTNKEE